MSQGLTEIPRRGSGEVRAIRVEHYVQCCPELEAAGLLERLAGYNDRLAKSISQAGRLEDYCLFDLGLQAQSCWPGVLAVCFL